MGLSDADQTRLEQLVDNHGMREVLIALAAICEDKAQHLHENWEGDFAVMWNKRRNMLMRLAELEAFKDLTLPHGNTTPGGL